MVRKKKKSAAKIPPKEISKLSELEQKLMQAITKKDQEKKHHNDLAENKNSSIGSNENFIKNVKHGEKNEGIKA